MTFISLITKKLAIETLLAQVGLAAFAVYFLFFRKKYPAKQIWIARYGLLFAFLTASAATCGSLFYSNIVGFAPCDLCWLQRIFMYPLVILLGLALLKKDAHIVDYGLSLSGIGFLLSLYHNYMNYGGVSGLCQILNTGVSCTKRYVFEFGYITIPMMALTAFALIIVFLVLYKYGNKKTLSNP